MHDLCRLISSAHLTFQRAVILLSFSSSILRTSSSPSLNLILQKSACITDWFEFNEYSTNFIIIRYENKAEAQNVCLLHYICSTWPLRGPQAANEPGMKHLSPPMKWKPPWMLRDIITIQAHTRFRNDHHFYYSLHLSELLFNPPKAPHNQST